MQCMMTAMGATGSAAGLRSYVAAKHFFFTACQLYGTAYRMACLKQLLCLLR